jgi:hypothetical protein
VLCAGAPSMVAASLLEHLLLIAAQLRPRWAAQATISKAPAHLPDLHAHSDSSFS